MTEYTVFKLDDASNAYCIREIKASSIVKAKKTALEIMPKNNDNVVITLSFSSVVSIFEDGEWLDFA